MRRRDLPRQASYETGGLPLTDGVVPFADVEGVSNAIGAAAAGGGGGCQHTLRFLPGVGHFYREEGAVPKLSAPCADGYFMIKTESVTEIPLRFC
eukprot:COSAG01_NODE_8437_length_2785_cov_4.217424_2_plen_95_part_00